MATISAEQLTKVYPNGTKALDSLDLEVADGELMVLVGPSGCGKTTALRMVAGLEQITSGTLRIGENVVNDLPARERDIAMVFQNYALYPHMTVAQNIGFALKLRRMPKAQVNAKVREAARILGLTKQLRLRPAELSGGQRQRVAMGRAIVREPVAFLMDEPLSNLDAKLRVQMRAEISRIQRRLGVATLYVTHDQTEAMTMGDRVAVLDKGVLQQCGPPQLVYDRPDNMFVAAFIGSPAMNLYRGALGAAGDEVVLGSQRVALHADVHKLRPGLERYRGRPVVVGMRPEHLMGTSTQAPGPRDAEPGPAGADADGAGHGKLRGDVELVEALGSDLLVHFHIDAERVHSDAAESEEGDDLREATGSGSAPAALRQAAVARLDPRAGVKPGERVTFLLDTTRIHFFDASTTEAIWD